MPFSFTKAGTFATTKNMRFEDEKTLGSQLLLLKSNYSISLRIL